ncbi:hypothetical protein Tco_0210920 [Tanacetum coccineum]
MVEIRKLNFELIANAMLDLRLYREYHKISDRICPFILNGGAVDWKSSKQSTTAMSATEAEYIAASEAAMEAVWIRKFISGLEVILKHDDLALVVNIEFVPSIVEEDATGPLVELIRCVYGRTQKLM